MNDESNLEIKASGQTSELDHKVLDSARNGDHKAFTVIVRHYEQMVYNFSFKVCRDRAYAEDTLQDTFVNVHRKLKQFDGKSKFSTWLYSIVANNCLMKRRSRKLEEASVSIDEVEMPQHDHMRGARRPEQHPALQSWRNNPLEEAMTKELRERLDEAIQKLPVDYRLVFILRDIEGQSAEETAKIMKLSIPAVKSRLRRARVFLREQLNEYLSS
jgi:RNA polymerase sigma-70 factor, ECF subfamily